MNVDCTAYRTRLVWALAAFFAFGQLMPTTCAQDSSPASISTGTKKVTETPPTGQTNPNAIKDPVATESGSAEKSGPPPVSPGVNASESNSASNSSATPTKSVGKSLIDNPLNLMAGGAVLAGSFGVVASFWSRIKAFAERVFRLFIQRVEIPSETAHDALISYLVAKFKRSRSYDRLYAACYEHTRDGRYGLVPYEQFGLRGMIFWQGYCPFIFNNEVEKKSKTAKGESGGGSNDATKVYSTITFVRGTVNVERLLREACDYMNSLTWSNNSVEEKVKTRFSIHFFPSRGDSDDDYSSHSHGLPWFRQPMYRLLSHQPDQLGKAPLYNGRALDNLIFPQRIKDLIREIELWRSSRDWYRSRGIPWKRGWLLYGPPGTGKTALARAFAEDLNMPIYVFNLAEMANHDLIKAWANMQVNVPCIALIEDIDNVFHGRENVARKHGLMSMMMMSNQNNNDDGEKKDSRGGGAGFATLTFDCLLNCLDGVERSDGIFTIITTNDIGKVDPALGQPRKLPDGTTEFISTRPGRIDKAVELTYMEPFDKKEMAKRILSDYPEELVKMDQFVDKFPSLEETPAQFQERCAQVALACFWNKKQAEEALAKATDPNVKLVPAGVPAETSPQGVDTVTQADNHVGQVAVTVANVVDTVTKTGDTVTHEAATGTELAAVVPQTTDAHNASAVMAPVVADAGNAPAGAASAKQSDATNSGIVAPVLTDKLSSGVMESDEAPLAETQVTRIRQFGSEESVLSNGAGKT